MRHVVAAAVQADDGAHRFRSVVARGHVRDVVALPRAPNEEAVGVLRDRARRARLVLEKSKRKYRNHRRVKTGTGARKHESGRRG